MLNELSELDNTGFLLSAGNDKGRFILLLVYL